MQGNPGKAPRALRVSFLVLALSFMLLGSVRCDEGFREDELECERAAIHVEECCPGVERENAFACEYQEPEACRGAVDPALTASQGRCLHGTSCSELVASGTCAQLLPASSGALSPRIHRRLSHGRQPWPRFSGRIHPARRRFGGGAKDRCGGGGIGLAAHLGVDIAKIGAGGALFLLLRGTANAYDGRDASGPFLYGPTLAIGFRQ